MQRAQIAAHALLTNVNFLLLTKSDDFGHSAFRYGGFKVLDLTYRYSATRPFEVSGRVYSRSLITDMVYSRSQKVRVGRTKLDWILSKSPTTYIYMRVFGPEQRHVLETRDTAVLKRDSAGQAPKRHLPLPLCPSTSARDDQRTHRPRVRASGTIHKPFYHIGRSQDCRGPSTRLSRIQAFHRITNLLRENMESMRSVKKASMERIAQFSGGKS